MTTTKKSGAVKVYMTADDVHSYACLSSQFKNEKPFFLVPAAEWKKMSRELAVLRAERADRHVKPEILTWLETFDGAAFESANPKKSTK